MWLTRDAPASATHHTPYTSSASWKLDPKGVSHGRQTTNEIPHERVTQTYA